MPKTRCKKHCDSANSNRKQNSCKKSFSPVLENFFITLHIWKNLENELFYMHHFVYTGKILSRKVYFATYINIRKKNLNFESHIL